MKRKKNFRRQLLLFSVILTTFAIIIIRREDAFTNPQFWAEDGTAWFYDAYNNGPIVPLFWARNGYLQTISRIGGSLSLLVPLAYAPLLFNTIALFAQALPAFILLSKRWKKLIPSFAMRVFIALVFLWIPNTKEVHLNLTNVQWHLAVASLLLILGDKPRYKYWKFIDGGYFLIAGLSGPFSIFLTPIAIIMNRIQKSTKSLFYAKIVTFTGALQFLTFITTNEGGRSITVLPNAMESIFHIFSKQIVWGGLIGSAGVEWLQIRLPWAEGFITVTGLFALFLVIYAFFKGRMEIKLFVGFGAVVFFLGLFLTQGDPETYLWEALSTAYGLRYWYIPIVSFLAVVFWSISKKNHIPIRLLSLFFICSIVLFRLYSFQNKQMYTFPPFEDHNFQEKVAEFENMNTDDIQVFPLNPPGWEMALTKK